ncbi:rod shape-determining protein [Candidatus Curtissbacteria bacterium RIFCSPLOWO2_02_FULL_40_11]|nr:MAG: rod shape-determining protein [Candidatus Curtissbacteria bacterium RIFCSPLOWO2_02_FULL_40_11]
MRIPLFSSKRLGIDLGTSNCLVWSSGRGIILSEPSVVAVDEATGRIEAVGQRAAEMLGKTAVDLIIKKPLKEGVIADYVASEAMLKHFLERSFGYSRFSAPEVMISVPYGITQVERRAVLEATLSAGARTAYLIDQPLAAAVGAKLPIEAATGSMILDMGGGQVGSAVVSLGGIVAASGARAGGDKLNEEIITYVRRIHNLIIGDRMAEDIKLSIGSALKANPVKKFDVRGRDAISGLPKSITIDSNEVTEAIQPALSLIVNCLKNVLEQTPPELASDIIDRGLVLTGGTAQLRGMERYISNQIGVSAHLWEDPMHAVVYGTGVALENIDIWRKWVHSR